MSDLVSPTSSSGHGRAAVTRDGTGVAPFGIRISCDWSEFGSWFRQCFRPRLQTALVLLVCIGVVLLAAGALETAIGKPGWLGGGSVPLLCGVVCGLALYGSAACALWAGVFAGVLHSCSSGDSVGLLAACYWALVMVILLVRRSWIGVNRFAVCALTGLGCGFVSGISEAALLRSGSIPGDTGAIVSHALFTALVGGLLLAPIVGWFCSLLPGDRTPGEAAED